MFKRLRDFCKHTFKQDTNDDSFESYFPEGLSSYKLVTNVLFSINQGFLRQKNCPLHKLLDRGATIQIHWLNCSGAHLKTLEDIFSTQPT